jgi:hypothetical protein
MRSLILGDCDHLIKFILFGDEGNIDSKNVSDNEKEKEERQKEIEIRHIPRNKLWPGETQTRYNVMESAIDHCRGKFRFINLQL